MHDAVGDAQLLRWLRGAAQRSRRVTSVCTGAFLLAAAGLLEGRRATTHWAFADRLAERHPEVNVEPNRIFVRDDPVWTSAGVTAGIDLALALVEDDHGREAALEVARWLVVFATRPGGQSQFSAALSAQTAERRPLREVQQWVLADPARECTVEALAERACMSPRNFSRAFRAEAGLPRRLGRDGACRACPAAARGRIDRSRGDRRGVRLRHGGDHAPGLPAAPGREPWRIPTALPRRVG